MANIEKKTIEERIDKNKDNIRDYMEIRDFLLEDKNQTENIKDLWEYLNNIWDSWYNEIKQTLQSVMEDPEIIKMFEGIEEKVKKNENLTDDEISVLYINAVLYWKWNWFINVGEFDLSLPIEKICNGYLLAYIQKRYNNYNYNPNKEKWDRKPTVENTKKEEKEYRNPNVPSPFPEKVDKKEQIEREYEWLPQIPPISQRWNEYIHSYCNKIYKRAEDNWYLMMAEYESRLKNEFRSHFSISEFQYVNDKEFDAYVKYDKMLFAFSKYCEVINKKHEQVIEEAGYHDMDEISQEMKYFSLFQDLIKEKYPELEAIMKRLEPYWGEMEENKNKYFGGKTDEEIEKAWQNFKEFQEFQNKKSEEYWITDEMIKSLNTTPNTKEETEEYFKNLNKVLIYQNVLNGKKWEYWDTIDNYYWYMIWISEIQKRYSEADFDTIKNYSKDLETRGQNINFERCRKYASLIDRTWKYGALWKDLENIGIIQKVLMDPTNDNFFILDVKNAEIAKKLRQERIDKTRDIIKTYAPQVYWSSTILAWFWNWLVDSTIWVWTSLWAMITWLIWGKEHYQSQLQKKERRDNFLKFNQSSSQKEAVYDGKSLNFKRDNTISTVSGSIAQMLCLIYWWSAVWKWIGKLWTKAWLTISENVVSRAWLFWMSFITQVWQSYWEAINSWLDWTWAFAYSMLSASIQSWLELISPNDVLLWKWTWLWKQLISSICKNEWWIKLVWKYFLKSVWREILEENLQEWLQLAAWNLVMEMVNGIWNSNFEIDRNPKNFLSTAIITTLTTWITTWFSAWKQWLQILNSDQPQLISRISADTELYEEVMDILNKTIEWKFTIPNVSENQLKNLKKTLELINTIQEQNNNESQNTEPEDQENESSKQQTEDAESHDDKTEENVKTKKKRNQNYFDWQSHEFEVTQEQAIENSKYMDNALENVINETDEWKLQELLNDIKNHIEEQYEKTTGQKLNLSEDQVWSILDAHSEDGILWKLTRTQLSKKVRPLIETITDGNVRRFLLEFGFCWRPQRVEKTINIWNNKFDVNYIWKDWGDVRIINADWTETIIDFWNNRDKYLSINIEWKINENGIIELLHIISNDLWLNGKIWIDIWQIEQLETTSWKTFIEELINSKYFSAESLILGNIDNFKNLLKLGIELPQKMFSQDFLKNLIVNKIFFEARAEINYLWNEQSKTYFKEMVWKYLEWIDINSCESELLSDLIIDYHFNKISYNVFLDIRELFRYQIEKWKILAIENLKIYRDILNIDKLSNEEKIKLHKSLIWKNISEMFDNDLEIAKKTAKKEISDSILNHETIEQYRDDELTKKYWVEIYNLEWQPFYALVKRVNQTDYNGEIDYTLTNGYNRPDYAISRSFSLVWTENTGVWGDTWFNTFIYEWISPEQILHVCNEDSWSWSNLYTEYWQRTDRVYFLWWPSELLWNTKTYNELLILIKWNENNKENNNLNDIKPFAMYTYKINDEILRIAKKYWIWIVLINENEYNDKANQKKWHTNLLQNYMYPWWYNTSTNYINSNNRSKICTFENINEINNMIWQ